MKSPEQDTLTPTVVELVVPSDAKAPAIVLTPHIEESGGEEDTRKNVPVTGTAGTLLVPGQLPSLKPADVYDFEQEYQEALLDHIPCHWNKWVLLVVFTIFFCFFGQEVLNWPPFRSLLAKEGAYAWLCGPDDLLDPDEGTCEAQRNVFATLASLASSFVYIGSALAGAILDFVGPKWMVFIGCSCMTLGNVFLMIASESIPTYYPGFVFLGVGSEQIMTGMFDFTFLFPGMSGLILSIFSVGRSIAFAIPILMNAIWTPTIDMRVIMFAAACISLVWTMIVCCLVPKYPYLSPEQFELLIAINDTGATEVVRPEYQITQKASEMDELAADGGPERQAVTLRIPSGMLHQAEPSSKAEPPETPAHFVHTMDQPRKMTGVWGDFGRTLISIKYWPWVATFMFNVFRCTYFGSAATDQLGPASNLYVLLSPLSFIPCVPFGVMADRWGIFAVAAVINTSAFIAFLTLSISTSVVAQYCSVCFYFVLQSYSSSQNYVFNAQLFPQRVFSKLVGFSMLCAGLFGFVAPMLYDYAGREGYQKADAIVAGISFGTLVVLVILYLAHHDKLKMRREIQRLQSKNSVQLELNRMVSAAPSQSFAMRKSMSRDVGGFQPTLSARLSVDPAMYVKLAKAGRSSAMAEAFAPSRGPAGLFAARGSESVERTMTVLQNAEGYLSGSQMISGSQVLSPSDD